MFLFNPTMFVVFVMFVVLVASALSGSVSDSKKIRRLQRSTTNQTTINIGHRQQRLRIVRFHTATIKNLHLPRRLPINLGKFGADEFMYLLRHFWCCCLASSNGPNWFIGNDDVRKPRTNRCQHRRELLLHDAGGQPVELRVVDLEEYSSKGADDEAAADDNSTGSEASKSSVVLTLHTTRAMVDTRLSTSRKDRATLSGSGVWSWYSLSA